MNEKKIQGRLKKTITAVAATGGILLAAAGFFGFFLLNSVERTEASVRMSVIALDVLLFALLLRAGDWRELAELLQQRRTLVFALFGAQKFLERG